MPNVPKKIPTRRCVGCGEHFPKGELCRVVRQKDGTISLDKTGKLAGRGAYLCNDPQCLAKARRARRLESALSCAVSPQVYEGLEAKLHAGEA